MHRQQLELTDDLLLQGHWGKEDAAVRSFCFCLMSSDAKSILGTIYKVSVQACLGYIIVKTMGGGGGGGSEVSLVHLRINIWIGT